MVVDETETTARVIFKQIRADEFRYLHADLSAWLCRIQSDQRLQDQEHICHLEISKSFDSFLSFAFSLKILLFIRHKFSWMIHCDKIRTIGWTLSWPLRGVGGRWYKSSWAQGSLRDRKTSDEKRGRLKVCYILHPPPYLVPGVILLR